MFGFGRKSEKAGNDNRPIKVIRISENSWQIVYADE